MCSIDQVHPGPFCSKARPSPCRGAAGAFILLAATLVWPVGEVLAAPVLPSLVPIEELSENPYRHVGLVRTDSFGMDPTVLGSGWVAGERVVASAAHVFFVEETLGWNRNRWYWKRAAAPGQFWNTNDMLQPRGYRVLAGYSQAAERETVDQQHFMDARNRDVIALMFYRTVSPSPAPPRALNSLGGAGTFSIVGYPVILGGVGLQDVEMHAHIGGHAANFTLSDEVTTWGGWPNAMFKTVDISSGPGGSGGPVFKLIDGQWTVAGSLLAGITNVAGFCRSIDNEFEQLLVTAISDSTVSGPGQVIWELDHNSGADPIIRADGSVVYAATSDTVVAVNTDGVELWARTVRDWNIKWVAEAPDGRVLVGTFGDVTALEGSTGRILWQRGTEVFTRRGAVGEVGQTYVSHDLALVRVSPLGVIDWRISLPFENLYSLNENAPAIGPDGTVFVASQTRVYGINPNDGSIKWRSEPIQGILERSLCAGVDGSVTLSRSGGVMRLEPDGSVRWRFDDPIGAGRIHVRGDGSVVVVKDDGYGLIILKPDGSVDRRINMPYGVQSATEDDSGHVYVGTSGGVVAFDADWNQVWRNDAVVGRLSIGRQNFLVGSGSGSFVSPGIRALGTFSGAALDLWQASGGGPNGARRVANSLPQSPRIVISPEPTRVVVGYRLELVAAAEGTFPMTFEWRRNGELLADHVGQRLIIQRTTAADAGDYIVTVRNVAGESSSAPVAVEIGQPRFGDRLWTTSLNSIPAPALGEDGTVYSFVKEPVSSGSSYENHYLVAVDALGNEKWRQALGTEWYSLGGRSPVVGDDGRIYATTPGHVWAFAASGSLLWKVDVTSTIGADWPLVVLARDNGVFFRNSSFLGNITPEGTMRWQHMGIDARGMEVRRDGKLVIGAGEVISQDGVKQVLHTGFKFSTNFGFVGPNDEWVMTTSNDGGVTLGSDGTLVARNPASIYDRPLFMLGDGSIVTDRLRLEPFMGTGSTSLTTPGNGKLIGILEGDRMLWTYGDGRIAALDRNGKIVGEATGVTGTEFTITSDGVLIGGNPLAAYNIDWGVSNSPWPLPLGDSRNTNRGPVSFDLQVLAPKSVVLRGRPDPYDTLVQFMPFQDGTMQGYVGYGTTLVASVNGSGPFDFRWFRDGRLLEGQNAGELRFDSPTITDSGDYVVSVTNEAGTTYSEGFTLNVSAPAPVTPGTYVRMWTNSTTSESWPLVFKVTSDRYMEFNLFDDRGVQGKVRLFPDGSFHRVGNLAVEFSGSLVGSTLSLSGSGPLALPPAAVTGVAPNGLPAGIYRGHATGQTGFPVTVVVFADGSFNWLQRGLNGYSSTARSAFAGSSASCGLQVGNLNPINYTVHADNSGALVGTLPGSTSLGTGFVAVWAGRPEIERFTNLSTRGYVSPDQPPMIAGFFVEGVTNHSLLLRAVGPALADLNVQGPLLYPDLRLMNGLGQEMHYNAGWTQQVGWEAVRDTSARVGAFPFKVENRDSALLASVVQGGFTALVSGTDGGSGVALVEIYEDRSMSGGESRLRNLSTRGTVGSGERVLIGGFYVSGSVPKSMLIRAVGPSLAQYSQGQFNTASNPRLRLFSASDTVNPIATNDDYWVGGNEIEVRDASSRVGAFALSIGTSDAAMVLALPPGGYTAVVDIASGDEGVVLLEIYEIPSR